MTAKNVLWLTLMLGLTSCWFGRTVSCSIGGRLIAANSNDVEALRAEIDSDAFHATLARAARVPQWSVKLSGITLSTNRTDAIQWESSTGVGAKVADALNSYLSCRAEGHSAAYACDVLALRDRHETPQHKFLDDISSDAHENIPERWISMIQTETNSEGGHYILVDVLDGELVWSYELAYGPKGLFEHCRGGGRRDAIELNPAYTNLIAEVERLVERKVEDEGKCGLGTCHFFWALKKQLLKERGVKWRSPAELNPDTLYD